MSGALPAVGVVERPGAHQAAFRVGLRSLPYLADHGFQDMVVLPGSFYIDLALRMERDLAQRRTGVVTDIRFYSPVILSVEDTVIRVEAREADGGRIEYLFFEADARQHSARLEIDRNAPARAPTTGDPPAPAAPGSEIDSEGFYRALHANGNQYGPRFRNVRSVRRSGNRSFGELSAGHAPAGEPHVLRPELLDAVTQLLASFVLDRGRTFVLRSIGELEIASLDFPETLLGEATLLQGSDGDALLGNVRVMDASGRCCLALTEVALALLDPVQPIAEEPALKLVVAANFTAEPLEDSLKFWGEHFGARVGVEFAPYNQVFQQLLDPASALHRNGAGANAIALALEDWAAPERPALPQPDAARAARCFGSRPRHVLPNGAEIVHLNRYETEYLYREIFEDRCYLRHGIRLRDDDTVVDVGANIGLFSLFVLSQCPGATIYACEPAPALHDLLQANCGAYGSNVRALDVGLSDRRRTARFTFYEKSSVFSGFHSEEAEDRAAIEAVVRNMLRGASIAGEAADAYVRELTADRLRRSTCECRLLSLSDLMREQRIERIDLLKIDAEKSELDILAGIEDGDWPKIRQIVIEIHDRSGAAVGRVRDLLVAKGFRCRVEQEALLESSGLYNVYALRGADAQDAAPRAAPAARLARHVGELCAALGSFAGRSSAPLLVCLCPPSPRAASDADLKAALDDAEKLLHAGTRELSNVHLIAPAAALQSYPVADYYDAHAHRVGHVPYTPEGYAAIGSALFRRLFGLKTRPYKVIVLDCDNTLWKGVCGEDGPLGVELTPPFRALQEFVVEQANAGMLLCLCSKNNESDVLEVLERRAEMPLKREHLVSWRINWRSKPDNLRSLAEELDLGLDSFIFIDDNPVECADVRIRCPEVLTLQLPPDSASFAPFLRHVWAFDRRGATAEDRNRTRLYRQNRERHRLRDQAASLKDFVAGLQLRVEVAGAREEDLERVSQLTQRTNQFNFTTRRRSTAEIRDFVRRGVSCWTVRVSDRFGDYGLVGALIYEALADRHRVDTFLLSCRVLGRGVEHELVQRLGRQALADGKPVVELAYAPTAKNAPALEFANGLEGGTRNPGGGGWMFAAEQLAAVRYDPERGAAAGPPRVSARADPPAPRPAALFEGVELSARLQDIGERLCDVGRLVRAIEDHRLGRQPADPEAHDFVPGSALEKALARIWRMVLGRSAIGLDDNFFDAGGTSLRAVQVVAAIKRELKRTASIVTVFECPTVRLLAARLERTDGPGRGMAAASAAALRGRQRRVGLAGRRAT